MYLGIDIGGTKTLIAALDDNGVITESDKFPTNKDYTLFLKELAEHIAKLTTQEFAAAALAMPITEFDRVHGIGIGFGNLPWKNVTIQSDVERIIGCPLLIDNDAKLACLSEAMLLKDRYHKVLYVTVSTGIGFALTVDGKIDENAGDGGGRTILLEHEGKLVPWESFAGGHAIVEHYGKLAMDITDEKTWKEITRNLSLGLLELVAIFEPDVIVIGGSVGTYFDRYGAFLHDDLVSYKLPLLEIPPIIGAQRPEQAVVYGCYDLIKQQIANAA